MAYLIKATYVGKQEDWSRVLDVKEVVSVGRNIHILLSCTEQSNEGLELDMEWQAAAKLLDAILQAFVNSDSEPSF